MSESDPPQNDLFPAQVPVRHMTPDAQFEKVYSHISGLLIAPEDLAGALRDDIDWLIDSARTARTRIRELDKTEKTYLGTRVERLIRSYFGFEKGRRDLVVCGIDVDVKNTIAQTWTIGPELIGELCLLVRINDTAQKLDLGVFRAASDSLNPGANRDGKRSVSAKGMQTIKWLLDGQRLPSSPLGVLSSQKWAEIAKLTSGNERVAELFRSTIGRIVRREAVQAAAMQKDYMKRLRKNGGARDTLEAEGILVLGDRAEDAALAVQLGLPSPRSGEFIAVKKPS
jgi:hypothetical protein